MNGHIIKTICLEHLQDLILDVILDSQDINDTLESVGFPEEYRTDITGMIVLIHDGDYLAIWLTESCAPYDLTSIYHPLPYYKDEHLNSLKYLPYVWSKNNSYYRTQQLTELLDKKGL